MCILCVSTISRVLKGVSYRHKDQSNTYDVTAAAYVHVAMSHSHYTATATVNVDKSVEMLK